MNSIIEQTLKVEDTSFIMHEAPAYQWKCFDGSYESKKPRSVKVSTKPEVSSNYKTNLINEQKSNVKDNNRPTNKGLYNPITY